MGIKNSQRDQLGMLQPLWQGKKAEGWDGGEGWGLVLCSAGPYGWGGSRAGEQGDKGSSLCSPCAGAGGWQEHPLQEEEEEEGSSWESSGLLGMF